MPVTILNLEICKEEAERFLLRVKAALKEHRREATMYIALRSGWQSR